MSTLSGGWQPTCDRVHDLGWHRQAQAHQGVPWQVGAGCPTHPDKTIQSQPPKASGSIHSRAYELEILNLPSLPEARHLSLELTPSSDEHDLGQVSVEMHAVLTILRV